MAQQVDQLERQEQEPIATPEITIIVFKDVLVTDNIPRPVEEQLLQPIHVLHVQQLVSQGGQENIREEFLRDHVNRPMPLLESVTRLMKPVKRL